MEGSARFKWWGPSELSSADLLRKCGEKLTDGSLWEKFHERFREAIFMHLHRALKYHSKQDDFVELVADLAQDVYLRLVQNNGSLLRSFRGNTDFSVMAFLARVSTSVVTDHLRAQGAGRRIGENVVSIDEVREQVESARNSGDELNVSTILGLIDVERIVAADPDRKNANRNALIFKLHYIDGFTAPEIAAFAGFGVTEDGVEAILSRLRKRIRQ